MRTVSIGGGAISDDIASRLEQRTGLRPGYSYGMSETTCLVTVGSQQLGSVGKLMPNMSAKLVGGQLMLKGPNITKGYFNNPKKTSELFTEDGWMKTGDICEFDDDGNLFIIGRLDDVSQFCRVYNCNVADVCIAHLLQGIQSKLACFYSKRSYL